jgi:hypothetical protein
MYNLNKLRKVQNINRKSLQIQIKGSQLNHILNYLHIPKNQL